MHARDTAESLRLLVQNWLPEAVRRSIGLQEDILVRTACFLGAVHDIGKATAAFQSNILQQDVYKRQIQAIALLYNSDELVSDIAFKVGFRSLKTFNRVFKSVTGSQPGAYRKLLRQ